MHIILPRVFLQGECFRQVSSRPILQQLHPRPSTPHSGPEQCIFSSTYTLLNIYEYIQSLTK